MSAQYTPYRNEDGMETDPVNWGDQEVGDVEIYQKTTEDIRVVSNKNLIVGGIGIAILGALLGLLVGYFAHSEHTECVSSLAVALHSVQEENPYIRKKILEMVSKEEIKGYIKSFSSEPHLAGSPANKLYADKINGEWLKNGLDKVDVVDYEVLLSYPDKELPNVIKVVDDYKNVIANMETNYNLEKVTPPFSAYSMAGNFSGNLVYVNYGRLSDLRYLKERRISLEGKMLIAKQMYLAADEQALNAIEFKAAGLILYPDPISYNPPVYNSSPYPKSWWLPGTAARTDSILWNVVGDPQTPGYPAKNGASRLAMQSLAIPRILVQPVSYDFAYKLLSNLAGEKAPDSWKGGFNITYKIGPKFVNPTWKIIMKINNKYENKTISNVIGHIRGKTEPDRYVIIGSHRDAWGYGAVDSASGTAALLELSRVFGILLKQGWRPRRTIMFCSWGAEEYNLIGSTEWLEENLKLLHGRAVAYINTDVLVSGNSSVSVAASPLLYNAIFNATKEVSNPNDEEKNDMRSVYDAWLFTFPHKRNSSKLLFPDKAHSFSFNDYEDLEPYHALFKNRSNLLETYIKSSMQVTRPLIRKMDMRSNYAPFFVLGGIPAVDVTYVTDSKFPHLAYPLYHTEYDDFNLIKSFIDPTFEYHSTVTKILGELLRDLSDSLFLPFNLFDYAQVLEDFYLNLQSNDKGVFQSLGIDLLQLEYAVKNFTEAAYEFHSNQETADLSDPMAVRRINDQLLLLERAFLDPNGLPRNMFKRHIVLSPSESIPPVDDIFPGLIDELANLMHNPKDIHSMDVLRTHFSLLVLTIHSAAKAIQDV